MMASVGPCRLDVLLPAYAGLYPDRWQLPLRQKEVQLINGSRSLQEIVKPSGELVKLEEGVDGKAVGQSEDSEGGANDPEDDAVNTLLTLHGNLPKVRRNQPL